MHLSAAIPGGWPRVRTGNSAGFADFCRQFLARDGGIGPLLHFRGNVREESPAGLATSPPSFSQIHDHVRETRQSMQNLVPWTLREDFGSKIKENEKKWFVSIASNLTRLEIETDRDVKNIVFAITFFQLVPGEKRLWALYSPV